MTDINKHYPLGWMVDEGEIKVWSLVTGEKFPKNHAIHKSERNFIEEQITKYLTLSGQIECYYLILKRLLSLKLKANGSSYKSKMARFLLTISRQSSI